MVGRVLLAAVLSGWWIVPADAADDIVLRLSQSAVVVGDPVRVEVLLPSSDARIDSIIVDPPHALQKAGSSNNVSIINGRMSQSYTQNFQLVPTAPGLITLGPAQVFLGGRVLRSNVVQLVVQAAGAERQLAVDVTAEPSHVWEGQPFRVRTTVRHGAGLRPVEMEPPSALGVERFEGQTAVEQSLDAVTLDGTTLSQLTAWDWRVPHGLGTLELANGSIQLEKTAQKRTRFDPFAGFFSSGRGSYRQPLPVVRVQVRPLPALPPGLSFAGLVGTVEVQWQNVRVGVDRTKALLRLAGHGQASSFELESWVQGGYRVYPDAPEVQHGIDKDGTPVVIVRVALTYVPVSEPDSDRPAWFDVATGLYRAWDLPPTVAPHAVTQAALSASVTAPVPVSTPASISDAPVPWSLKRSVTRRIAQAVMGLSGFYLLVLVLWRLRMFYRSRRTDRTLEGTALRAALRVALVLDTRSAWERLYRDLARSQDALVPGLVAAVGAALYAPNYTSPAQAVRRVLADHDAR